MDISNLLLQLTAGAITGYVTNSMAIKMLFKDYGPFGGVIVKTRDEFIENISQLVERDIINENTLEHNLNKPEVKKSIKKMVNFFFNESFNKNTDNIKIKEVPGVDNTVKNIKKYIYCNFQPYIHEGLNILLPEIKLKKIISKKQYEYISNQLFLSINNFTQNNTMLKKEFKSSLNNLGSRKLYNLFLPETLNIINNNIDNIFTDIEKNPEYIYYKTDIFIKNLSSYLNIKQINDAVKAFLKNRTLKDYQIDSKYLYSILENLNTVVQSKKGSDIIFSLYNKSKESLIQNNISLDTFKKGQINNEFISILDQKITAVSNILKNSLYNNQSDIDNVFNKIIFETLKNESHISPLKASLKKSAFEIYQKNSKTTPTEILSNSLDTAVENNLILNKLDNYLEENLKNTDLNSLFITLENKLQEKSSSNLNNNTDNKNVNNDTSPFITNYLSSQIENYIKSINENKLKEISAKKLSELINFKKLFNENNINKLIRNNAEFKKQLLKTLSIYIKQQNKNMGNVELKDLINPEKSDIYYDNLVKLFQDNEISIKNNVIKRIYENSAEKNLNQFITPENMADISKLINKLFSNHLNQIYQDKHHLVLNSLFKKFINKSGFNKKTADNLVIQLNENLPFLLKGNISSSIKNNLENISDNDIKDIVESFVGKELKPITYFGAFLGTCSAALLYLLQINTSLLPAIQLPVSMLVYGFIGYITNVIAIKMVFKPYEKKKILGINVPFTPGVVSKEKDRFAESVGKFIDEELLNYNTVKNTLENKKNLLEEIFKRTIKKNNYIIARNLFNNNISKMSSYTYKYLQNNRDTLSKNIANAINNHKLPKNNHATRESLSDSITGLVDNYIKHNSVTVSRKILDFLKSRENLSSIIPDSIKENINRTINNIAENKIDEFLKMDIKSGQSKKSNEELKLILTELLDNIYTNIKEKPLNKVTPEIKEIIADTLFHLLKNITISNSNILAIYTNNLVRKKSDNILENIEIIIENNRIELKNIIISQVKSKMGFWSTAGKLVDLDKTLDDFADRFIEKGIPEIIEILTADNLDNIITQFTIEDSDVKIILELLFTDKEFKKILKTYNYEMIEELSFITLETIFKILDIDNPSDILQLFSGELTLIKNSLNESISNNKYNILNELHIFSEDLLEKYLYNIDIDDILKNIDDKILSDSIRKLYNELEIKNQLKKYINILIREIINQKKKINNIINKDYLESDINRLLDYIFSDKKISNLANAKFKEIYQDIINNIPDLVNEGTANYLIDIIIISILETLQKWLPDLVEQVNIKDITIKEIEKMDPGEIENLFYSFAGNYFGKLENYGWFGSIVGLLSQLINLSI